MRMNELYRVSDQAGFVPLTNIVKKDGAFEVALAVPGYREDQLNLTVENGLLEIQGTIQEEDNHQQYLRREIRQQSFRYRVELPEGSETEHIEAQLSNGVLAVRIPLQKKRKIAVAIQQPSVDKVLAAEESGSHA